jgi:hypothetical protein
MTQEIHVDTPPTTFGDEPTYEPYDPRVVEPPSPESGVPTSADDSPGPDDEAGSSPEAVEEPLPEFDPHHRDAFEGLLFLGALTKRFYAYGHHFVIRSLMVEDMLEVALLHKEYVETLGQVKAFQTATVASALVTVDDRPIPQDVLGEGDKTPLYYRFRYVAKYHPNLIDAIYEQQTLLEVTVSDVMEAMGKVPG